MIAEPPSGPPPSSRSIVPRRIEAATGHQDARIADPADHHNNDHHAHQLEVALQFAKSQREQLRLQREALQHRKEIQKRRAQLREAELKLLAQQRFVDAQRKQQQHTIAEQTCQQFISHALTNAISKIIQAYNHRVLLEKRLDRAVAVTARAWRSYRFRRLAWLATARAQEKAQLVRLKDEAWDMRARTELAMRSIEEQRFFSTQATTTHAIATSSVLPSTPLQPSLTRSECLLRLLLTEKVAERRRRRGLGCLLGREKREWGKVFAKVTDSLHHADVAKASISCSPVAHAALCVKSTLPDEIEGNDASRSIPTTKSSEQPTGQPSGQPTRQPILAPHAPSSPRSKLKQAPRLSRAARETLLEEQEQAEKKAAAAALTAELNAARKAKIKAFYDSLPEKGTYTVTSSTSNWQNVGQVYTAWQAHHLGVFFSPNERVDGDDWESRAMCYTSTRDEVLRAEAHNEGTDEAVPALKPASPPPSPRTRATSPKKTKRTKKVTKKKPAAPVPQLVLVPEPASTAPVIRPWGWVGGRAKPTFAPKLLHAVQTLSTRKKLAITLGSEVVKRCIAMAIELTVSRLAAAQREATRLAEQVELKATPLELVWRQSEIMRAKQDQQRLEQSKKRASAPPPWLKIVNDVYARSERAHKEKTSRSRQVLRLSYGEYNDLEGEEESSETDVHAVRVRAGMEGMGGTSHTGTSLTPNAKSGGWIVSLNASKAPEVYTCPLLTA